MRSPARSSAVLGPSARLARILALAVPALLLGGAYVAQYGFGLYPCEMCWWQRYPHFAALALAGLAFVAPPARFWTALAAIAVLVSAAIGLFHAGVEYGWWQGITSCARIEPTDPGTSPLEAIMNTPMISCDDPQWSLFGISLAGFNFLFSAVGGLTVLALLVRKDRA
jgi:disulfide bond formation protein DsbB